MVKALAFKGEKKPKKRKANVIDEGEAKATTTGDVSTHHNGAEDGDSWVSADVATDIAGPVIIILPSTEPTCVACDASGAVFASNLENVIEGDPATAEPHDVRQVWVANKIAGTENLSFKGPNGRYLGCDTAGLLSAKAEAISSEESFLCITSSSESGTFDIQTQRGQFLTILDDSGKPEIRGNAESISLRTTSHIRMQARFKPKLMASKESKGREKISRKALEEVVGRKLDEDEVRRLKKARAHGEFHEAVLDARVKGKHDKYS
ncbi:MAG: hypothetical protein Q9214_004299 [Letrouitia sp. 1 TL-2023]